MRGGEDSTEGKGKVFMWRKKMDSYPAVPLWVGDTSMEGMDYLRVYEIIVVLVRISINATPYERAGDITHLNETICSGCFSACNESCLEV